MGWYKVINATTGKLLYDSRVDEMSPARQEYIAQLVSLKETCEPETAAKMDRIIDSATRREFQEQLLANIDEMIAMRRRK